MLTSVSDLYITIQHRVVQETLLYKDEQIREAQNWMARMQENVLQSTTLQAELRERTDQYTQLWLGCQRQVDFWTFNESVLHLGCCFYEFLLSGFKFALWKVKNYFDKFYLSCLFSHLSHNYYFDKGVC